MPELPEVETVVRGLRSVLSGKRILDIRLSETDFIEDPAALEQYLPGSQIARVRRHGKFVVLDIEPSGGTPQQLTLLIHLGMTGQLVTCPREAHVAPHTHVFFTLDDGRELRYTDPRRFGRIRLLSAGALEGVFRELGFDPLEASEAEFITALDARRARIKALLLDQHVMRGMGNIYTDESLWHARVHPMRLGTGLKKEELRRVHRAVRAVLTEAIRMRGSSISDYVDADGEPGEFQGCHCVYQREGKKCFRCSAPIRRVIVAGRSSYFCPLCQRAPRSHGHRSLNPGRPQRQR
jgi:formamidopyrimidine-DNA glycosylase